MLVRPLNVVESYVASYDVLLFNSWSHERMFSTTVTQANPKFFLFINHNYVIKEECVEKLKRFGRRGEGAYTMKNI